MSMLHIAPDRDFDRNVANLVTKKESKQTSSTAPPFGSLTLRRIPEGIWGHVLTACTVRAKQVSGDIIEA